MGGPDVKATTATPTPIQFPDGGTTAWLQVLAGWFLMLNTWGLVNCFGFFQTYYTSLSPPLASTPSVSWIGSLQSFLLLFVGAFCGQAFDTGLTRRLTLLGSILCTLGLLTTSFSGEFADGHPVYWQTLLAQGICTGIGMGLLFVPSVAIVATYFQRRRARALGVVTTGASVGGVVYPIMLRELEVKVGFSWAVRAMALVVGVTLAVACVLVSPRMDLPKKPAGAKKGWTRHFKEANFSVFLASMFLMFLGVLIPYTYLASWIVAEGVDMGRFPTAYLLSLTNAAGIFGRLIPSVLSDIALSPILVQGFSVMSCGILILGWIRIHSLPGVLVFCILYGFFSGASISLPPASMAKQTSDMSALGIRMGLMFTAGSFACLVSYPIYAALLKTAGGWDAARAFAGAVLLVAGAGMGGAEVLRGRRG